MKRLTGTILLTIALLAHVGIIIATEEHYTFSSNEFDYKQSVIEPAVLKAQVQNTGSSGPLSTSKFGLMHFEEQNFAY